MEASDEVVRDVKAACYYRLDTSKRGGHVKKQWLGCNKVLNIIYRMEMAEQRLAELVWDRNKVGNKVIKLVTKE